MWSEPVPSPGDRGVWEVAVSRPVGRGVGMVGFRESSGAVYAERIVAGPAIGVVIDCAADSLGSAAVGAVEGGVVVGVAPASITMVGRGVDCVELQIDPVTAVDLFDVPLSELNGAPVDLSALWGPEAGRLRARLLATSSWQVRFAEVRAVLVRRHRSTWRIDPEVADAWRCITTSRGRVPIGLLHERYGWSRTRFWRRFKAQIGVSPKRGAMTVRFDHALRQLSRSTGLAEVAATGGYADQSHLSREVLEFAGRTPSDLAADPLWAMDSRAWTPTIRR